MYNSLISEWVIFHVKIRNKYIRTFFRNQSGGKKMQAYIADTTSQLPFMVEMQNYSLFFI